MVLQLNPDSHEIGPGVILQRYSKYKVLGLRRNTRGEGRKKKIKDGLSVIKFLHDKIISLKEGVKVTEEWERTFAVPIQQ